MAVKRSPQGGTYTEAEPDRRFRSPTALSPVADIYDARVWSSLMIGPGACGMMKLFAVPIGQEIQRFGRVPPHLFTSHTEFTTNIMRAGCLGSCIGDMAISGLHLDFVGASLEALQEILDKCTYALKINGKRVDEGAFRNLPRSYSPVHLVGRDDSLELEIGLPHGVAYTFDECILVRAVLSGKAVQDVR